MRGIYIALVLVSFSSGWVCGYSIGYKNGLGDAVKMCTEVIREHTDLVIKNIENNLTKNK